jgi:ubiquinol-cytochrome c reductase cytochrome c1 subunit
MLTPWVYKNANQAKAANNGAFPPDLSLMVKARKGGADYVYAFLTGFDCTPEGVALNPGQYWNKAFPGHLISMAPPLTDGQVTYADGTKSTVQQMARDVAAFLAFTAEPEMESRKEKGIETLLYLTFMTILFYAVKRRVWKNIH